MKQSITKAESLIGKGKTYGIISMNALKYVMIRYVAWTQKHEQNYLLFRLVSISSGTASVV
jgi:hypothetical protein